MIRSYLTIALRVFKQNAIYSTINVVGLSVGLACCVLVFLFVTDEWSYDTGHSNGDDIYRVYRIEHRLESPLKVSEGTPIPLGPTMQNEIPGIEAFTRYMQRQSVLYVGGTNTNMTLTWVDPAFFEMFDFAGQDGEARELLATPESLVLTFSAAEQYFPNPVSVGEAVTMLVDDSLRTFNVTAIIPAPPENSSFQFEFVAQMQSSNYADRNESRWTSNGPSTYVMLASGAAAADVQKGTIPIIDTYLGESRQNAIEQGWWEDRDDAFQYQLQPLREVHLTPGIDSFYFSVSDPQYSYILLAIAFGVLLIACLNFITLSVGRSSTRAREVGMRKTLGAARSQLMAQFWGEALLISGIAVMLGLTLASVALPVFNEVAQKSLTMSALFDLKLISLIALLTIGSGLLAGSYPALLLSGFKPTAVLKGSMGTVHGWTFSRVMIVFQFVVSIAMVTAVLIMHDQMRFVSNQDLGYDAEEILVVNMNGSDEATDVIAARYAERIAGIPGVTGSSGSSSSFGGSWSRTVMQKDDINHLVYTNRMDPSFLETMGIELLDGRNLSDEFETDVESAVLVNEAFVEAMGWGSGVGERLPGLEDVTVVGVVENFKFLSVRQEVPPIMLHMSPEIGSNNFTMVRFNMANVGTVRPALEAAWKDVAPTAPFVSQFLDERIQRLYDAERRWQNIITYSAILAFLLSSMGLFGMAAMSTARRTKEIGVRKVLGASTGAIVRLLTTEFAALIAIALVLATPLSFYVMSKWLSTFAYQISIGPGVFLLSGLIALAITLATVCYQSVSAATADPVDSLQSE
jgi:putative ABC transport system permease protein